MVVKSKTTPKIVIVGCGVVGAMVAYELSHQFSADIRVLDRQPPAQGSTGAALGVLMGAISGKVKGRTWRLREASIRRYKFLIAELLAQGYTVPFNQDGIISLCFDQSELPRWETLRQKRLTQGWPLEIWSPEELQARCPQVNLSDTASIARENYSVKAAIYSPADGQVHPTKLTHALISAAEDRGVAFCYDAEVTKLKMSGQHCFGVQTSQGDFEADWVILSAGLGSAGLSELSDIEGHEPLELMPVLGQAMEIQLPEVLGKEDFQPVINGDDIHLVPLGEGRYWIGATVEFPDCLGSEVDPRWLSAVEAGLEADRLVNLRRGAEGFVGAIAQAKVIKTWSGLRPRPVGQPAPVIKPLGNLENVTLATGHYRNGVLLAPATAQQICSLLKERI